jgi:hypothetical protein
MGVPFFPGLFGTKKIYVDGHWKKVPMDEYYRIREMKSKKLEQKRLRLLRQESRIGNYQEIRNKRIRRLYNSRKNATPAILKIYRPMGMSENQVISSYESLIFSTQYKDGDCIIDCIVVATLGEGVSQLSQAIGKAAIEEAKRKAIKTGIVKLGSKVIPGLGYISTAKTIVDFAICTIDCPCMEK